MWAREQTNTLQQILSAFMNSDVIFQIVKHTHIHTYIYIYICGPGSSVSIATELRAGRSGVESRWGRGIPPVQTGPGGPPSLLYNGYRVIPGGKVRPGRAADHSPPSSAAVMEE